MLKDLYKYIVVSIVAALSVACADMTDSSEIPESEESRYITFDISEFNTKSSEMDITEQEFIIWIFDESKTMTTDPYFNGRLQYDESQGWGLYKNGVRTDLPWGEGTHTFYAYNDVGFTSSEIELDYNYPSYTPTGSLRILNGFDITGTSSSSKNFYKDLMTAANSRNIGITDPDYSPIPMDFKHVFASLEFNVVNQTNQTKVISNAYINNFRFSIYSYVNVDIGTASPKSWPTNAASSSMSFIDENTTGSNNILLEGNASYELFGSPIMVIPQSWDVNTLPMLKMTVNNDEISNNISNDNKAWEAGNKYTFNINIKSVDEPNIGDYFYKNGTYSSTYVDDPNNPVVGIVFWTGDPTEDDSTLKQAYPECTNGLIVATTNYSGMLMNNAYQSFSNWGVSEGLNSSRDYNYGTYSNPVNLTEDGKKKKGYNNTEALKGFINNSFLYTSDAVTKLNEDNNSNGKPTGTSSWYLPSISECKVLHSSLVEMTDALEKIGLSISGEYWSVSEENSSSNYQYAATYNMSTGTMNSIQMTNSKGIILICSF